jgi:hypothetical protein
VETWGFTLLGCLDGYEEVLLLIWYFFYKRWITDTFLVGLVVRE